MHSDREGKPDPGSCRSSLSYRVPVEVRSIRRVRKRIESFATDNGFTAAQVGDISLAVAEAIFNAMEHGSHADGTIGIDVEFLGDLIRIAVEDVGSRGRDEARFEELRRALAAPGDEIPEVDLERGRGLFLIRAKSDEVYVERTPDGGLRVVMVKRR